jgi:DNA-binding NtrC family response regulator
MATGELIEARDLPQRILQAERAGNGEAAPVASSNSFSEQVSMHPAATGLAAQERELIVRALEQANGNQSDAARKLGIGRDALRYKMKKHGIC